MFEQIFWGFLIGFVFYIILLTRKMFFQVPEGSVAILSCFGKAITSDAVETNIKVYPAGLHFKWPWQKVKKVSVKEQILDLSKGDSGTMLLTADGTLLQVDAKLRFVPLLKDIYAFLFSMEKPIEHIKGLFNSLLHQEISKFSSNRIVAEKIIAKNSSSYALLRSERNQLNTQLQDYCAKRMPESYGYKYEGLDIIDMLPPEELAQALNTVLHAQSEAEKNYALKEAECEQKLLAAKKGIEIAKAKAKSVEAEILTQAKIIEKLYLAGTLSEYLERREIEVLSEARLSYIKR